MPISRLECPADGSHTDGLPGRWVTPGKNGGNAADMLVSYERLFGPSSPGSPVLARTYRSGAVVTHLAQLRSPEDDLPIAMFAKVDGLKPDQRIAFGHFRNDGYSNILRILPANAYRDTPDSMQPLEDPRYAAGVHVSGWRQRQV